MSALLSVNWLMFRLVFGGTKSLFSRPLNACQSVTPRSYARIELARFSHSLGGA